ncbi:MAG: HlyD family type I secretion periplasmic adaptor subunit [Alphaproteobacteria bacterium]
MSASSSTLRVVWDALRDQDISPQRSRDELDFLPAHLAIAERPPARGVRLFAWTAMALCGAALLWTTLGRIDVIAPAPGRLIVSQHSKVIQAPEDAVVTRIAVRDGQRVHRGETLIELDQAVLRAEKDKLTEQIVTATLERTRLEALLAEDPDLEFSPPMAGLPTGRVAAAREHYQSSRRELAARDDAYAARLRQNQAQQASLRAVLVDIDAQLANVGQRLQARQLLVNAGNFPRMQLLELDKERIELLRTRTEKATAISVLESEAGGIRSDWEKDRATTRRDLHDRITAEERKLSDARQDLLKVGERSRLMTVKSPVDGVVQQLAVHTVGGVTKLADTLMVVVPDDAVLEAEVSLLSKDAGFTAAGQPVEIKIDSFPYTKYGTIRGTVTTVSRDSAKDEKLGLVYPTRIRLDRLEVNTENGPTPLSAGMTVSAEIRTGDRRVIEYLLSPLQEYASEAMRER